MTVELRPHPNYLKVQNTFLWAILFCIFSASAILIGSAELNVLIFLSLFLVNTILIRTLFLPYQEKIFQVSRDALRRATVRSTPLHRAFGVVVLKTEMGTFRGIHSDDLRQFGVLGEENGIS